MSKDIDKLININDDDVEIIYRRKAKSQSNEDINGFNPIVIVFLFVISIIGIVAISSNNDSSNNTIIVK